MPRWANNGQLKDVLHSGGKERISWPNILCVRVLELLWRCVGMAVLRGARTPRHVPRHEAW